jgi:hypothetical protein
VSAKTVTSTWNGAVEESVTSSRAVVILASVILFFFEGMENTNFQYLMVFNISTDLRVSKSQGSFIDAAFQAFYAIGRGLGVFLALWVKPVYIISVDLLIVIVANVVLICLANSSTSGLWMGSILLGLGFSTVYGNMLSYVFSLTKITNFVGGLLIVSGVVASAIYPVILGGTMDTKPLLLIQANLLSITAVVIFFAILLIHCRWRARKRSHYFVI